jgi:streptogramin lyase
MKTTAITVAMASIAAAISVAACLLHRRQRLRPGREVGGELMRHFVAALALLSVAAVGVSGCSGTSRSAEATSPTTAASRQSVLPLTGLENPQDVAVDTAGNVYVTDLHQVKVDNGFPDASTRVIKLAAGSDTQTQLPQFVHASLMTDPAGAVWVQDGGHGKLVKLAVGPDPQTVLPLVSLGMHGVVQAVDAAGNVYGTNGGGVDSNGGCCLAVHVVSQAVGSDTPTVLPFNGIDGSGGIAVDTAGDVYVGDYDHNRVLKLAAGSDTPTVLPFTNVHGIIDVAVDRAGSVYAVDADRNRVLKVAAGSDAPTVVPFDGIEKPIRVTVDTAGNVYVIDGGHRRVLKLAAPASK